MPEELKVADTERDTLVEGVAEAHEAFRLMPGVNENGPGLVVADHLLDAHRDAHGRSEKGTG